MRHLRLVWLGPVGIAMSVLYGACASLETYPGDPLAAGGAGNTAGTGAAGGTAATGGTAGAGGSSCDCPDELDECQMGWTCKEGTCEPVHAIANTPCDPVCLPGNIAKAGSCDGRGHCMPGEPTECVAYKCDASTGTCKSPCVGDSDCVNGKCEAGKCKSADGAPCSGPDECDSSECHGGVCCVSNCAQDCLFCTSSGACSPVPAGVVDQCGSEAVCDKNKNCVPLGDQKAVGQPCVSDTQCFNYEKDGPSECRDGLCRILLNAPCNLNTFWYCSTRFCDANGICAQCSLDSEATDCQGGKCIDTNGVLRCLLDAGFPCGDGSDCVSGDCTPDPTGTGPGTCQ